MTKMQTQNPEGTMIKDMTDDQLRQAYTDTRILLWNASQMNRSRGVFRMQRELDIIVSVARRRGLSLR